MWDVAGVRTAALMALVGLVLACSGIESDRQGGVQGSQTPAKAPAATESPAVTPGVSAPFDLAQVVQRARLRFRQDGTAFTSAYRGWRARVEPNGRIAVDALMPREGEPRADPRHPRKARRAGATLVLETASVQSGGVALPLSVGAVRAAPDGSLTLDRGSMVEELRSEPRGVEQSWRFERRPAGRGDVEIWVRASGARFVASDADGLVFAGEASQIRYSHAVWIDARGRRTEVASRWEDGAISLRVPAAALDGAEYPAVLDPWSGPVKDIGDASEHFDPGVASDGANGYLVAFNNDTCGDGCDQIEAIRVTVNSSNGTHLDAVPTVVYVSTGSPNHIHVGFAGGIYFVVWDETVFVPPATFQGRIYGAPVTPAGVAGPRILVSGADGEERAPVVSSGGGANFLVVWEDDENQVQGPALYGRTVIGAGTGVSPAAGDVLITDDGGSGQSEADPEVAWDGSRFVVSYTDTRGAGVPDIFGIGVTLAGAPPVPTPAAAFQISRDPGGAAQMNSTIACHTGTCLVAWEDQRNFAASGVDIYRNRVRATGADAADAAITTAAGDQSKPLGTTSFGSSLADSAFMLIWSDRAAGLVARWYQTQTLAALAAQHPLGLVADATATPGFSFASSARGQYLVAHQGNTGPPARNVAVNVVLALPNGHACPSSLPPGGVPGAPTPSDACLSHLCADGVCCNTSCSGVCDRCDGVDTPTPAGTCGFVTAASTTVCRAGSTDGICDPAEQCDGAQAACPANVIRPTSFVCRAAPVGVTCDVSENCPGTAGASCPADGFKPAASVCRAGSGDSCDLPETCTGSGAACPANVMEPSSTPCRPSAGLCDIAENCPGTAGGACPSDALRPLGFVCLAGSGDLCDPSETCSGTGAACPANVVAPTTTVCRVAADICDVAETCPGTAGGACPSDALQAAGVICRAGTGLCDPAEVCSGTTASCPSNAVATGGTPCRAVAGPCDIAEACDGTSGSCPANAFAAPGTSCRAAASDCDLEETCSGTSAPCPADLPQPDGALCSDGDTCTTSDECQAGACAPGTPLPCNDGKTCTTDSCNASLGCRFAPVADGTVCNDGNDCTSGDRCTAGACSGAGSVACDDSNPCTVDPCSPTGGCQHAPVTNGTACDDADACTAGDTCVAGACAAGQPLDCGDTNDCTNDSCDVAAGCAHAPVVDGTPCSGGACQVGVCEPIDAGTDPPDGAAGQAGAAGADGQAGTAGAAGQAGTPGAAGADAGVGGVAGATGGTGATGGGGTGGSIAADSGTPDAGRRPAKADDEGCGCRVAGQRSAYPIAALFGLLLLVSRRRFSRKGLGIARR